jgi:hypothetical protein
MRSHCVASVLRDNRFGVLDIGQIGLEGNVAVEKEGDASSTAIHTTHGTCFSSFHICTSLRTYSKWWDYLFESALLIS